MRVRLLAAFAALTFAAGCATAPGPEPELYEALGGEAGVTMIVDELVYRATGDRRIAFYFDGVDLDRLREMLAEQICDLAGGPCDYSGETMAESHRGMGVDAAAFNTLVELLVDSMEAQSVPVSAQNRLLRLLAPMHADIVGA